MNDSVMFQGLARAMTPSANAAEWPLALWRSYFECPVLVVAHLQQFLVRRSQEQARFISEVSHERNPSEILAKQIAFMQQSAVAWSTEMVEVSELAQAKLMGAARTVVEEEEVRFPKAA